MKKISLFVISLFILMLIFIKRQFLTKNLFNSTPSPTPLSQLSQQNAPKMELNFNNQIYQIFLEKIVRPGNVRLIPNFTEQKNSLYIKKTYHCQAVFSGQFYTAEHTPLGFLQIRHQILSLQHDQSLFNGFLVSQKGRLFITEEIPQGVIDFAFQAGPIIHSDVRLNIYDDKHARRILFGQTESQDVYFWAIVQQNNIHSGPLLADIPQLLNLFNQQSPNLKFKVLINLDGGSASAFINNWVTLTELAPVGSFLCAT